jgi:hypothetical protein
MAFHWEVFCRGSPSGTSGMGMSEYFGYTGGTRLTFIDALHFLPQEYIPWVDFSGTFCLPGPLHDFLEVVVYWVGSELCMKLVGFIFKNLHSRIQGIQVADFTVVSCFRQGMFLSFWPLELLALDAVPLCPVMVTRGKFFGGVSAYARDNEGGFLGGHGVVIRKVKKNVKALCNSKDTNHHARA